MKCQTLQSISKFYLKSLKVSKVSISFYLRLYRPSWDGYHNGCTYAGNGYKRPWEKASYGYKWQQSEGFHVSIPTLKWSIKLLICDQHQAYIGLWLTLEKTKILSEYGQSSYKSHICFTFGGSKFLFDTLVVRFNVLVLVDYERWSTGVVTMTAHTGYHRATSCHVSA